MAKQKKRRAGVKLRAKPTARPRAKRVAKRSIKPTRTTRKRAVVRAKPRKSEPKRGVSRKRAQPKPRAKRAKNTRGVRRTREPVKQTKRRVKGRREPGGGYSYPIESGGGGGGGLSYSGEFVETDFDDLGWDDIFDDYYGLDEPDDESGSSNGEEK